MKRSAPLQRRTPLRRGKPLRRHTALKRTGGLKRTGTLKSRRRRETAAEKRARQCFDAIVTARELCFFADVLWEGGPPRRPGHECDGELDAHHIIRKSWIQEHFNDLPEDELLAIKYAPIIGCPLCRCGHDRLPNNLQRGTRIWFEELDPDLIAFVRRVDERYRKRGRPSIEVRLELECPRREFGAAGESPNHNPEGTAAAVSGRSLP